MYPNILTEQQKQLLPHLEPFSSDYYLVGGTAIALYLGHRRSIDFDFFTESKIKPITIKKWMDNLPFNSVREIYSDSDQIHVDVQQVRVTFFSYPYHILTPQIFHGFAMPTLLCLAVMKAFALGQRAKWKDYIDLYFILKHHFKLKDIIGEAEILFGEKFNGKLFRQQLYFFDDIDYTEDVEFMKETVPDETVKNFLHDISTEAF